jgi:quercetin dioxygenase-like cupin family protein/ribonuclease HI
MHLINVHTAATRAASEDGASGAQVRELTPPGLYIGLALDLWEIAPGGQSPSHRHPEEHMCYVLAGEGTLYGKPDAPALPLRAGAAIYIGPDELHRVVNTGRAPLQILVSTPLAAEAPAPRQAAMTLEPPKTGEPALKLLVVFDGGSEGNPGRGYGSFHVEAPGRRPQLERREYPGLVTNNEAEYLTLIAALEYILDVLAKSKRDPKQVELDIRGDSQLVIKQLKGEYKIKAPRMLELADQCHLLLRRFGRWHLTWHERAESVELLGH